MSFAVEYVPSKGLTSGPGYLPHGSGECGRWWRTRYASSTASWLLMAAGPAVLFEVSQLGIWDGWAMQVSTIFCNSAFLTARAVISTVMTGCHFYCDAQGISAASTGRGEGAALPEGHTSAPLPPQAVEWGQQPTSPTGLHLGPLPHLSCHPASPPGLNTRPL